MIKPALLALSDGSIFRGTAIGASGHTTGEVVFNTAMTGYQEILTDPSYAQQIVTLTYPHIGNTGTNAEDEESSNVWASGLVIRDLPRLASNFRDEQDLASYLKARNIVAISDIDTRRLTRLLRDKGALGGCISTELEDPQAVIKRAQEFAGLSGKDLAKEVSTKESYSWKEPVWELAAGAAPSVVSTSGTAQPFKVVAYDFGVKRNILRILVSMGAEVTVVPAKTSAADVLKLNPDGVFLSNGPGDPEPCDYAIDAIKTLLDKNIPLFGICLGHQLLALAAGAKTMKMKLGHHGANHPVQDLATKVVAITSQNHGFAVDDNDLPDILEITHRSLFDNTLQGLRFKDKPAYGFQGHPEASPGPRDAQVIFEPFFEMMKSNK